MKKPFLITLIILFFFPRPDCFAERKQEAASVSALQLSLVEVSGLALSNNLDIQIAKLDALISRYNLDEAKSTFDTYLNMGAGYYDNQSKTPSPFLGTKSLENYYNLSLEKKLPTGTSVKIEGSNTRNWTDSSFTTINPAVEAEAKVSVTQPVGKNFFGLVDRLGIKITKLDIESSEWLSLDNIEKSLASVQKAYWELVLRQEELKIKKDILKEAEELYRIYKEKQSLGLSEDPDIFASQANVNLRKRDVLVSELRRITAKNDLLLLLNEENTDINIEPQDELDTNCGRVSLYEQLRGAIDSRRDYRIAKNQVLSKNIDLRIKRNSLWPEIDLEASYARNGLSGRYKQSWQEITDHDNPEIFLGITVRLPIENRGARAEYNKAKLEKEKSLLSLKKIERTILTELNNLVTQVNILAEEVTTLREAAVLQEKKLQAEKRRFSQGRSNSDLIIRYEEDLLQARLTLAQGLFSYRVSLIDLELARNTLLDRYWKDKI